MSGCSESEPFALQVLGQSMAPEFKSGCIVIVDPGAPIKDGSFVVCEHGDGVILRQLLIRDGNWLLIALEEGHPRIRIEGLAAIRGVVTQRSGGKRSERKSYI